MARMLLNAGALAGASLLAAIVGAGTAAAQPAQIIPGVTYERQVEFTLHGPVVANVLTMPRPGGLWSLRPVLSNGVVPGKERLTSIEQEQEAAGAGIVAGVNGDFSAADGRPSGMLMQGGVLVHAPRPGRSSIGLDTAGTLRRDRVTLLGTWQGSGQRRPFAVVNDAPGPNGVALYTPAWGAATPSAPGSTEVVLEPFPPATPNGEISGTVARASANGGTPIPADGAVLVGRGSAGTKLEAEAPVGQTVRVRLILKPDWSGVADAIGGGPLLVRNGVALFDAKEQFSTGQLLIRQARSAVGQLADGRIVLVTVDGGALGYSTGISNFELAQLLVKLGAVTAVGLEGGDAATMAFDGQLLSKPSGKGGEAPTSEGLLIEYAGVYAPLPSPSVISPNGDGVAESAALGFRVVRPSTVTVALTGPGGASAYAFSGQVAPGTTPFVWNGMLPDGSPAPEGTWHWLVTATDDLGRQSTIDRSFSVNDTLGFPKPAGDALTVPRASARAVATFTLTRPATVTARIETPTGAVVRTIGKTQAQPGTFTVSWDGVADSGGVVYSGRYVARVSAANELGTVDLTEPFTVRRVSRAPRRGR